MAESVAAGRIRTAPPPRVGAISVASALAVLEYCARVYRRNWRGTMFMTFFSPILFLGAMGFGLGTFVNTSSGAYSVVMLGFGLVRGGPVSVLAIPVGVLTGLCFSAWIAAFAATQTNDNGFSIIFRFLITPLFLFSGTFFPIDQLPA